MRLHHRLVNIVKRFRNDVAAHLDADAINAFAGEPERLVGATAFSTPPRQFTCS